MASNAIPFVRECKTEFGRFRVKVEPNNIFVGGARFCVNMVLEPDVTWLNWLSTDEGGCELDDISIRKERTVQMVDLAFSVLRTYFPGRTIVTLMDGSGYSWNGARQTKNKINFVNGYVVLYGKTWYEDRFGATMVNPERYQAYREQVAIGFDDPSRKPEGFSFGRNNEVEPLYKESNTWSEFIEKFKATYPDDKYKRMLDWYRKAVFYILNGMEIDQTWVIDISQRPMYSCKWTGGRRTRRIKRRFTFSSYHPIQDIEDRSWALRI
jgi:hypothetical protein